MFATCLQTAKMTHYSPCSCLFTSSRTESIPDTNYQAVILCFTLANLFLCKVWGCVPVSLIFMWLSSFPSTTTLGQFRSHVYIESDSRWLYTLAVLALFEISIITRATDGVTLTQTTSCNTAVVKMDQILQKPLYYTEHLTTPSYDPLYLFESPGGEEVLSWWWIHRSFPHVPFRVPWEVSLLLNLRCSDFQ